MGTREKGSVRVGEREKQRERKGERRKEGRKEGERRKERERKKEEKEGKTRKEGKTKKEGNRKREKERKRKKERRKERNGKATSWQCTVASVQLRPTGAHSFPLVHQFCICTGDRSRREHPPLATGGDTNPTPIFQQRAMLPGSNRLAGAGPTCPNVPPLPGYFVSTKIQSCAAYSHKEIHFTVV